ncbi:UspA domain-containing protein [Oleidesulfovibrio alaskensis G20]|uniref:UspA domain-containing protein n=1 Tax=Oleidesulfovibrio alaskensis (strain ATCC BAA-1058 / DSM 17464 / G20) TaxID=207559 RepID=Q317M7_OLEA2|nr:universal stress protein [Oleidesulfovibrio alaskensis]ABB36849.1 UspA domain-containing protein [Oleidesulfovibrio alaskensis G20]
MRVSQPSGGRTIPPIPPVPRRDVLVTVSETPAQLHAAEFAARFLHDSPSIGITLLYVAPPRRYKSIGPYGLVMGEAGIDEKEFHRHLALGNESLEQARTMLLQAGVHEQRIRLCAVPDSVSMDWDILHQGTTGGHAAIVLGNRGRTWLENMLEDTPDITSEMVKQSCVVPLWLCPPQARDSKEVLICVDGSASAFNAVHHIASLLGSDSPHKFTLLRVCRATPCGLTDSGMLFKQCRQIMEGQGIAAHRISTNVVTHGNVVEAILRLSLEGDFGLVVSGRRGMGSGILEHLMMGSVADKLFRRLRSSALCLCC